MRGSRIRPTYANVVATVALFVALGGTAIATHPGGQNTISTKDIIDAQVKTADIGDGEVRTADIGDGQVKGADIGDGEVKTVEIANGQVKADDIGDGEVNAAEIARGAVRTEEIGNGQVQAEDLGPGVAPGASGARAWGLVHPTGVLLRSKQVTAVTRPPDTTGIYCIDPAPGIDPTTAVMVVGEEFTGNSTSDSGDDVSHAGWEATAPDCQAGTMEVRTFFGDGSPRTFAETDFGGFNVVTFSQAFAFVIP